MKQFLELHEDQEQAPVVCCLAAEVCSGARAHQHPVRRRQGKYHACLRYLGHVLGLADPALLQRL